MLDRLFNVFQWILSIQLLVLFLLTTPFSLLLFFAEASYREPVGFIALITIAVAIFWVIVLYVLKGQVRVIPEQVSKSFYKIFSFFTLVKYFYLLPVITFGVLAFFNAYVFTIPNEFTWIVWLIVAIASVFYPIKFLIDLCRKPHQK
jgi:hypothetical protein